MIPVITIDGPAGSGKGTVAKLVAQRLDFHYLDSGALYRLTALACKKSDIDFADIPKVGQLALQLKVKFVQQQIFLGQEEVSVELRTEEIGKKASLIATYPAVREALLLVQREFRQMPGLVTDGRDMGTVIFPDALLKVFLSARVEVRAERRYQQLTATGLIRKEQTGIFDEILADLRFRDAQDQNRAIAPLRPDSEAKYIDTSDMSIEKVVDQILQWYRVCLT